MLEGLNSPGPLQTLTSLHHRCMYDLIHIPMVHHNAGHSCVVIISPLGMASDNCRAVGSRSFSMRTWIDGVEVQVHIQACRRLIVSTFGEMDPKVSSFLCRHAFCAMKKKTEEAPSLLLTVLSTGSEPIGRFHHHSAHGGTDLRRVVVILSLSAPTGESSQLPSASCPLRVQELRAVHLWYFGAPIGHCVVDPGSYVRSFGYTFVVFGFVH